MTATERIYRPGALAKVIQLPAPETTPSVAGGNGAGRPGADAAEDVKPFPLDCLPPAAADMARAIAHTERTPETLAGCCTLGILSASIGAGLQVQSGPERVTRGNLYLVPSAESGSGKSETFRHAAKPFHGFERDVIETWRAETQAKLESQAAMLESEIGKLKRDAGKEPSAIEREEIRAALETKTAELLKVNAARIAPALCCEDITTERLAVLLANNQEQLASLSPDAGSIVNNLLGRYSKLERTDEGIYLKAFSGDYARVDRQGREPVTLQWPCLTALWLVQPDKVETLLAERSLTDGGLIPRLLTCHTRAQPRPIVDGIGGIPVSVANGWAALIGKLLRTFRLASEPVTIEPTPEARQAMTEHFNGIVARRLDDLQDVTTYAARWNEQAWRIAVCLHAGLHGEDAGKRMMDADTARRAITLADWFAAEQLQILSAGRHAARQSLLDQVLGLLADKPTGIRASDVYRKRIVPSAEEARALLARLEAEGELAGRDSMPEGGGHVTRIYTKARQ
jgi:hypothetical protein